MINKNLIAEIARSVQCQFHWTEADIEKFAELIVAECAELCAELDGGENMFSRGIREHFGIE